MTTKTKTFDAVAFKHECQERVRQKNAGLSDAERRERLEHWLATGGDDLARMWRASLKKEAAK